VDRMNVPFDTTAFNFSYVLENRDDPFNPTTGHYFSSDIKVGFPLFEKSYSFIKFLWSYQKNLKFLKYGTLSLSVRNGFASGDMSITERFFAGGVHTFRGTKNDYLSPVDIITGKPKGGNALVLFNCEATFPFLIIPLNDFYYSVFYDVGNVFEKVNDFDMSRLERAIGFSLKIKTQMGPIRVDFGWNLNKRPEGNFEWNIGIGNVF
jgi:outer membrane protein insertion porin family